MYNALTRSERAGQPNFSDLSFESRLGEFDDLKLPIGHSITITRNDFSNFAHKDNDVPHHFTSDAKEQPDDSSKNYAYGWWFASKKIEDGSWDIVGADHYRIKGGEFFFLPYGVAVDFER
jgi:hypothetical protein